MKALKFTEAQNAHWFMSLEAAVKKLADWPRQDNNDRPPRDIGYNIPIALSFPGDATRPPS